MLTIVIPFWNGNATLGKLLSSNLPRDASVILVIDKDSEEPKDVNFDNIIIIRKEERGYFAGTCNTGIKAASPLSDILILNQDVVLSEKVDQFIQVKQPVYATFGDGVFSHPAWPKGYVQGTWMYMRRDAIDQVGLFNEKEYPHWGTTCEWQLRVCRAGYKAMPCEVPGLVHQRQNGFGSATTKTLKENPRLKDRLIRTPPEISVIVPTYNYAKFLRDCLNSLMGGPTSMGEMKPQTLQSFEIIIVDDHSAPPDVKLAQSYADPWKGIRVIARDQRGGTPVANNTGIAASYGKYIAHLSADDMRESWCLEEMRDILIKNPHSIVYDDMQLFRKGKKTSIWKMSEYDFEVLLQQNFIHAGIMMPKAAWKDVGGYPEAMTAGREDWAMNIALGIKGWCGIHIPKPGYLYRREEQNRSITNTGSAWREHFAKQVYALFKNIYDGERPTMCCGKGRDTAMVKQTAKSLRPYKLTAGEMAAHPGMIQVQYMGKMIGNTAYTGAVTRRQYVFSAVKNVNWVDQRDLITNSQSNPGLLELAQKGIKLFKLVPIPTKTVQPTKPAVVELHKDVSQEEVLNEILEKAEEPVAETVAPVSPTRSKRTKKTK